MIAYRQNLAPLLPPIKRQPPRRHGRQRTVKVPDTIDAPLDREIMELVATSPLTWEMMEGLAGLGCDSVRMWFYKEKFNPGFALVQAVLRVLGYRLKLERIP